MSFLPVWRGRRRNDTAPMNTHESTTFPLPAGAGEHHVVDVGADAQKGLRQQIQGEDEVGQRAADQSAGGSGDFLVQRQPGEEHEEVGGQEQQPHRARAQLAPLAVDGPQHPLAQTVIEGEQSGGGQVVAFEKGLLGLFRILLGVVLRLVEIALVVSRVLDLLRLVAVFVAGGLEVVHDGGGEIVGTAVYVNAVPTDPETGISATSSHWHQGAVAVEVAVDIETGLVTVERAHGAAWAGEVVSLPGARLQNEGNVVWGIGAALTECLAFDADGAPSVRTLLDYRLPATAARWATFGWVSLLGIAACTLCGVAFSSLPRSGRAAPAIVTPVALVLQFISGVFFPFTQLPGWMQTVAAVFPLKWMCQGMRAVFLPDSFVAQEPAGREVRAARPDSPPPRPPSQFLSPDPSRFPRPPPPPPLPFTGSCLGGRAALPAGPGGVRSMRSARALSCSVIQSGT